MLIISLFYYFFAYANTINELPVISCFFFFKQKTAYEIGVRLVGSEMCIRDRLAAGRVVLKKKRHEITGNSLIVLAYTKKE